MNKFNSAFIALAMMFSVVSCNYQDDRGLMPEPDNTGNKTEETNSSSNLEIVDPSEPLSLEISGYVGDISNGDGVANTTRGAISFGDNEDGKNGAPIIYKKSSDNYGVFVFKKLGSKNVHKRALKYEVRPVNEQGEEVESSTKAIIKIAAKNEGAVNGKIRFNYQESFADGEWYISGLLGTGESLNNADPSQQKFGYKEEVNANIDWNVAKNQDNNLREVNLPITLKWSKLNTAVENGVPTARASNLKFGVEGTVLSIRARSDMYDDVELSGLYMVGRYLSFYGYFIMDEVALLNIKNALDDNLKKGTATVPFVYVPDDKKEHDPNTNKNWNRLKLTFNTPGRLQAGYESSNLKIFAMPITDVAEGAAERDANNKTALRAAWYVKDSPDHSIVQNLRMASGAEITENSFENSKYYNIPINITTDLIISEIFSHNPEGHNYSWFELYNGTLHDIDLSDYALGRSQYAWRYDKPNRGYIYAPFPSDYTTGGSSIGAKYGAAMLTPLTMESPSEVVLKDGKPYSRTYESSKLAQKAPLLVQKWGGVSNPITLNGQIPDGRNVTSGYYWGRERVTVIPLASYQKDSHHNEDFTYVNKTPEQRRMLPPGKTIIILSYGYFKDRLKLESNGKMITSTLSDLWGGTKGYLHGPQMVRAYMNGYCHDMVSYASFGTSSTISGNDANDKDYRINAGDYASPVLHKSDKDGIFLVKRYPNGEKRIIDAFGPMYNKDEAEKLYKRGFVNGDRFVVTRNAGIRFPNKDGYLSYWRVDAYDARYQYSRPQAGLEHTSAGTRYYRSSITPNFSSNYDRSDRYQPKTRQW